MKLPNKPQQTQPQQNQHLPNEAYQASQDAIEALVAKAQIEPEKLLYYYLHDIASDLIYAARQLSETNEVEPSQLKFAARRIMAAHLVALDLFGVLGRQASDEQVQDTLRNPHRMKGVELP
ncbi:hypothetical protein [uncultured Meiothermus sp.]|jgi:3-oxoacyl-[acyl-carrier-protein] synthase III|uniref:hypothetical protein n=1 Tax=uncultured Meiothermus sp. TaxID=157471 RepID=UPI00260E9ADC|nr:hypothetical protein [uncultured Meiothermus sp.]